MTISPQLDAVHRLIIECHRKYFGESPAPEKVQRLCYYAQGYSLAEGQELFPEDFLAWQRGPSIPALELKYRDLDWWPICTLWHEPLAEAEGYPLVREIVASFGRFDGAELSYMTHRHPTWKDARGDIPDTDGCCAPISKAAMKAHFKRWFSDDE